MILHCRSVLKYAFIEKSCNKHSEFNLLDFLEENQKDDIKKQLGGEVFPFSSTDRFYCEKTIEYLLDLFK